MATMKVLMREDYNNPAAVKVVTDNNGYALFFAQPNAIPVIKLNTIRSISMLVFMLIDV